MADLTRCDDKTRWDEFVSSSPQGNVFCRSAFLDALGIDYDTWLLQANGRIKAGAVLLKDGQGNVLTAPYPLTLYHGVLLDEGLMSEQPHHRYKEGLEITASLLNELERHYSRLSFCLHHGIDDLRAFSWFHYHQRELGMFNIGLNYSGIIDLGMPDFEAYLATIRSCKRREYRLALKNGLTAETSDDLVVLEKLYRMTFERQGATKSSEELHLVRGIAHAALAQGFGEILLVRLPDGEVASATLFLHDEHTGYYLIGANHPNYRNTYSGVFAFVESSRRCHARGLKQIDVCGINSPNRGDFKTSFNAVPTPYFVVNWKKNKAS
jgi:hypothetical protein